MSDAVVEDEWQDRLARMRRILPLPLLLVSTAGALAIAATSHSWPRFLLGLPLVAVAAIGWTVCTVRPLANAPIGRQRAVFAAHTVLAGVLVWISSCYAVFAYTGFLFAYGLGAKWRTARFAATALVVSAGLSGGYPSGQVEHTTVYLVVAAVMLVLVLNSAMITNRAVEQNQERGRMIDALADANRRLEATMAENAELHAQLVDQAREAGIVEERQRLAGEIHDTLAQGLAGIIAQLQAAEQTRHRPDEWARHLAQARSLARTSLTEARRSVRALRPEQLEDASLPEAIGALARTWSEQSMIAADLDTIGTPIRLAADAEAALFRVAQEALSNVAKHARATSVQLTLTYLADTVLLDVADSGVGFDSTSKAAGYGLLGMRRRLGRICGTLTVESTPGVGTTINAAVPVAEHSLGAGR